MSGNPEIAPALGTARHFLSEARAIFGDFPAKGPTLFIQQVRQI
jgi:hypothetical protein